MGIISYAQNFEDVILWRVVGDQPSGFYIDIGAQHPILDSVSKAFYEAGWSGIHVEPVERYAQLVRDDRPRDIVLQSLVSTQAGNVPFYEVAGTGLSTAHRELAEKHLNELGWAYTTTNVPTVTLDTILTLAEERSIHWLKIDVEGHEAQVIESWGSNPARPWIVVVEATLPNQQIDCFEEWETDLLERGYAYVYEDGLNRYYLSDRYAHLAERFRYPPNYFDDYRLARGKTTDHLVAPLEAEIHRQASRANDAEGYRAQIAPALQSLHADTQRNFDIHAVQLRDMQSAFDQLTETVSHISDERRVLLADLSEERKRLIDLNAKLQESDALRSAEEGKNLSLSTALASIQSTWTWRLRAAIRGPLAVEPKKGRYIRSGVGAGPSKGSPMPIDQRPDGQFDAAGGAARKPAAPIMTNFAEMMCAGDGDFVDIAYSAIFYRQADEAGKSGHVSRLRSGTGRTRLLSDLLRLPEAQSAGRHDDLKHFDPDARIEALYRRILGRNADPAGREHFKDRLERSGVARVIRDMSRAPEAKQARRAPAALRASIERHVAARWAWLAWDRIFPKGVGGGAGAGSESIARELQHIDAVLADMQDQLHRTEQFLSLALDERRYAERRKRAASFVSIANMGNAETSDHEDYTLIHAEMAEGTRYGPIDDPRTSRKYLDDFIKGSFGKEYDEGHPNWWIGRKATVYLRAVGNRLTIVAQGMFAERDVAIRVNDHDLGVQRFGAASTHLELQLPSANGGGYIVEIEPMATFTPKEHGVSDDDRALGLRIQAIYIDKGIA